MKKTIVKINEKIKLINFLDSIGKYVAATQKNLQVQIILTTTI